jgi:hypothetical protein
MAVRTTFTAGEVLTAADLTDTFGYKSNNPSTIDAKTSGYTLALTDRDKLVEMGSSSAITLTIPLNSSVAFPVGSRIDVVQTGAGQVTIAGTSGVTVNAYDSGLKLKGQWAAATLVKRATDTWVAVGNLGA